MKMARVVLQLFNSRRKSADDGMAHVNVSVFAVQPAAQLAKIGM